jgi:hypothetical protein
LAQIGEEPNGSEAGRATALDLTLALIRARRGP